MTSTALLLASLALSAAPPPVHRAAAQAPPVLTSLASSGAGLAVARALAASALVTDSVASSVVSDPFNHYLADDGLVLHPLFGWVPR